MNPFGFPHFGFARMSREAMVEAAALSPAKGEQR
jgi:hypothetical protein